MFDEIRYELSMEIDRSKNIGITSLIKDYATFSNEIAYNLHNAGFIDSNTAKSLMTDERYFNFCVPLSILLGFCKDYKRVIIARHELILSAQR